MAAPKAPVLDVSGKKAKDVTLAEAVFAAEVKPHLVHEAVRAEAAAARAGTRAAKSRGLVSGGRSKPWRQKGTGRARAGTTRAPQWTGGGVAFAPTPRSFDLKVNRKARALGVPLGALLPRGQGLARRRSTRAGSTSRRRSRPPRCSAPGAPTCRCSWSSQLPEEESVVKSFRNLDRAARPRAVRARGRRARLGPRRPRHRGRARPRPGGDVQVSLDPRQVILAPVVSEKSYSLIEDNKYSFKVHSRRRTRRRSARPSRSSSTSRWSA